MACPYHSVKRGGGGTQPLVTLPALPPVEIVRDLRKKTNKRRKKEEEEKRERARIGRVECSRRCMQSNT